MKYKTGEQIILLDTNFKPVCPAIIKDINSKTFQYQVEYLYPGTSKPQTIWVSQERLMVLATPGN